MGLEWLLSPTSVPPLLLLGCDETHDYTFVGVYSVTCTICEARSLDVSKCHTNCGFDTSLT